MVLSRPRPAHARLALAPLRSWQIEPHRPFQVILHHRHRRPQRAVLLGQKLGGHDEAIAEAHGLAEALVEILLFDETLPKWAFEGDIGDEVVDLEDAKGLAVVAVALDQIDLFGGHLAL